ncbi:Meiotic central spindle [Carabus blaptoides fortunei]
MAGNLTENCNELCRLCASKVNVLIGINIFEGAGTVREINKKISVCLPIQVHEADHLPKMICRECVYNLDLFFTFREKTLQTESLLLELVKKLTRTTSIDKTKDLKLINEPATMELVTTIADQQLTMVANHQQLLDHHTNISQNMLVNQDEIILNNMHNHELEHIDIAPNELNSHAMSHESLHTQQLNLHHHDSAMAQLVQQDMQISDTQLSVPSLDLIHSQHSLIAEHYDTMPEKQVENTTKIHRELVTVKAEGDIKIETQIELDTVNAMYSDHSDSDDSSDPDFDPSLENSAGDNEKQTDNILANSHMFEEQKDVIVNGSGVGTSETSMQYYCNVCGKTVNDRDEYLNHYEEHVNKCLLCQAVFTNVEALKNHRKEVHPRKPPNRNTKSHKNTKSRGRLKTDSKREVTDDNFFKTESSNDEDEDDEQTTEFMGDDEEDGDEESKNSKRKRWVPKVCQECGKSYKTNYKLQEHMRKHTGEQPYKCSMCDKAFRSKIGLAQHEAKHTGQFDYACPTCGKGFQCKSYLIVHQRVHSDLKPYPCSTCGSNFKTKQSLLDHMNRHLGVKPFMCEVCGRGFITKGLCKSHQKVHSGTDNRQYPCEVCKKLFVSKSYLATHVRIHTGEKPFMCEVCGKGFLTRVDLRIHSTMHTGEKSFVCEMCGKAFARKDALRCHRRSHTGERPYRCDVCGQTFTQFSPMAIHKRLHTGERPYTCEVCGKTFVSRSTMMSHRKKHVPGTTV